MSGTARAGLHAVAVLYSGGSIAHLLRLVHDPPAHEIPYVIDWVIVILGCIGAATLAVKTRRIDYRGWWKKPVHFLIIFHLGVSVILHLQAIVTQSHHLFSAFPLEYSYFAIVYFLFFAWRSWSIRLSSPSAA